jgi:hypothetical protein
MVAAGLREIAARGNAEFCGQGLQEHRHEVTEENDAEKGVAELGAATNIGGPVAGIHIANGHKVARASESQAFAEPGGVRSDQDGSMRFEKRGQAQSVAPACRGSFRGGDSRFGDQLVVSWLLHICACVNYGELSGEQEPNAALCYFE